MSLFRVAVPQCLFSPTILFNVLIIPLWQNSLREKEVVSRWRWLYLWTWILSQWVQKRGRLPNRSFLNTFDTRYCKVKLILAEAKITVTPFSKQSQQEVIAAVPLESIVTVLSTATRLRSWWSLAEHWFGSRRIATCSAVNSGNRGISSGQSVMDWIITCFKLDENTETVHLKWSCFAYSAARSPMTIPNSIGFGEAGILSPDESFPIIQDEIWGIVCGKIFATPC